MFRRQLGDPIRVMAPEDDAGDGGGSDDKSGGSNSDKDADGKDGKMRNQAEVDVIMDAVRKVEEGKATTALAAKQTEIDGMKREKLTGTDKAISEAVTKSEVAWKAKWEDRDRTDSIRDNLAEGGVDGKNMRKALALVKEFSKPDAEADKAVATLKQHAPELLSSVNLGPDDGGNDPDTGEPASRYDPVNVEKALSKLNPQGQAKYWAKNGAAILEHQESKSGYRVVQPGVAMHGGKATKR